MSPTRSALATLLAAFFTLASAQTAAAQTYPTHPVRIIVSSAAGGPLDIVGRAVAEKISAALKQPVVVEARSGAGGNIAADFVSKSAPDGYTLLFTLSSTLTVNPHLYKDLGFNLKPITVVNYSTQTLFVHPSVPVNTVAEFVAWARKDGPVSYAHGGNGTSSHLVMEYFRLLAGFQTVGVPYRAPPRWSRIFSPARSRCRSARPRACCRRPPPASSGRSRFRPRSARRSPLTCRRWPNPVIPGSS